jgi:hypothetical protein
MTLEKCRQKCGIYVVCEAIFTNGIYQRERVSEEKNVAKSYKLKSFEAQRRNLTTQNRDEDSLSFKALSALLQSA